MRRWETAGFAVHTDVGLPTADAALTRLIAMLVAAASERTALATAGALARYVFDLTVDRFAWSARAELGTDVVLDVSDEDALVAAMSEYMWAHRHDGPATE